MENNSKIIVQPDFNRFQYWPQSGDTHVCLSIKFIRVVNAFGLILPIPFKNYSQTFADVINRFIQNMSYPLQVGKKIKIERLKTNEMISLSKKLQVYKSQIEDSSYCYFRLLEFSIQEEQQEQKKLKMMAINGELDSIKINQLNNSPANMIRVMIEKPDKSIIQVSINILNTVKGLKLEICKREFLDVNEFILLFAGSPLYEDHEKIGEYGIMNNSLINLIIVSKIGCFSPTSRIQVGKNESKLVSQLRRGYKIMSYNPKNQQLQEDEIQSIHKTKLSSYKRIQLEDQTVLQCTSNHKFLTANKIWKSQLYDRGISENRYLVGDCLINKDLQEIKIKDISSIQLIQPQQFFHLSVRSNHTFIINNMISHNMQIKIVNTTDGSNFLIDTKEYDTILDIKKRIEATYNIPYANFMLILNKKQIKNHQSLSDYLTEFKNNNYLELVSKEENKIIVNRVSIKKQYAFSINATEKVKKLKEEIEEMLGIPVGSQILLINNTEMENRLIINTFPLVQNYYRVNLLQIEGEQMTESKFRFLDQKRLIIKIKQNQYLHLNYHSLKELRVEQFIQFFVPNSNRGYSLMFGQLFLSPMSHLKEIEDHPIFNNDEINGYVVINYDKFVFNDMFKSEEPFKQNQLQIDPDERRLIISKEQNIIQNLKSVVDFSKLKEDKASFYKPIQYYTSQSGLKSINTLIKMFTVQNKESIKTVRGFNLCQSLLKSLELIENYIGLTHRLIKNVRFKSIYGKGDAFYIKSFISTHKNIDQIKPNTIKNSTVLHINSITGKSIGILSKDFEDEVVFIPFTYFLIDKIQEKQAYDQVWITEVPSPLTFQKNGIISVDDNPGSKSNKAMLIMIDFSTNQFFQLKSTQITQFWMREFYWILKWKDIKLKIVSDMVRQQGQTKVFEAGAILSDSLHNNFGYTAPIMIYCMDVKKAKKNVQDMQTNPNRIFKITNNQFDLLTYLQS